MAHCSFFRQIRQQFLSDAICCLKKKVLCLHIFYNPDKLIPAAKAEQNTHNEIFEALKQS